MGCCQSSTGVSGATRNGRPIPGSNRPGPPGSSTNTGNAEVEYVLPEHDDHGVKVNLTLVRDSEDSRDWHFMAAEHSKVKGRALPTKVDLRPAEGFPVYQQGHLGSCTANALCAAFHYIQCREGLTGFCPSRLFVYYNERDIEGHVESDTGASLRDGIKSLAINGVCDEKLWPYNVDVFTTKPPKECYEAALANRVKTYARVPQNLDSLKGCLAAGFPFVFGMIVTCDFMVGNVRSTGMMDFPPLGMSHGGHAIQACGYDDNLQCFIVRNSWGEEWGDKGHFYMPYSYMTHNQLCHDFWAIGFVDSEEFPHSKPVANNERASLGGA